MNIDGHTKMYCLIGSPVGHSGSPAMYNYSFDRLGINSAYLAYDVPLEKTGEAVAALRLLGCGGFNVTMPCKNAVIPYLDRITPAVTPDDVKRLDAQSGVPLYEQLYRAVRADIMSGALAGGTRLPSKRQLAANLRISQITVETAYGQLAAEGYIISKAQSGLHRFRAETRLFRAGADRAAAVRSYGNCAQNRGKISEKRAV